jgi:hypothetical protein
VVIDRFKKRSPPYVSYRSFLTLLEELKLGLPSRFDRSYWGKKFSGSTGNQLMSALRFLNLSDFEGKPMGQLKELIEARSDARADILKKIAHQSYSFLANTGFEIDKATYAQLEENFRISYKVERDVARKSIKFFIELADDAGIPLSPFITKKPKITRATALTEKSPKRGSARPDLNYTIPKNREPVSKNVSWKELLLTKFPSFDPTWPNDVQLKWFEAFDELLKRGFISSNE